MVIFPCFTFFPSLLSQSISDYILFSRISLTLLSEAMMSEALDSVSTISIAAEE